MEFNKVMDGIVKYINQEIYSGMNDWQELLARVAISRLIGNRENLRQALMSNAFIQTFAIMDGEGNVDIDGLLKDVREQIVHKQKISISIPLLGKFTFTEKDVDKLAQIIKEEIPSENDR